MMDFIDQQNQEDFFLFVEWSNFDIKVQTFLNSSKILFNQIEFYEKLLKAKKYKYFF